MHKVLILTVEILRTGLNFAPFITDTQINQLAQTKFEVFSYWQYLAAILIFFPLNTPFI
ncbi:hypothetical protein [Enterobacter hormaechei]|uniref:hypothetical protein n=1 Tax=Enterobacter hormaechei TaxID=158836 RepID=UPI002EDAE781